MKLKSFFIYLATNQVLPCDISSVIGWNSYSNHESLLFTSLQLVFQQDMNSLRADLHCSVFPTVPYKQISFVTAFFHCMFVDSC